MRVVHLLRKYNPAEWGGTETAIQWLFDGLRQHHVTPITYCPRIENSGGTDPLVEAGFMVKRFNACVPIFGISPQRERQFIAVGGNLMSFDLPGLLWREKGIDLIHSHVLNRLGSIAAFVARRRKLKSANGECIGENRHALQSGQAMNKKVRREGGKQRQPLAIRRNAVQSRRRGLPVTPTGAKLVIANHRRAARAGQHNGIRGQAKRDESRRHRQFEWRQFGGRCPVCGWRDAPAETAPGTVGE